MDYTRFKDAEWFNIASKSDITMIGAGGIGK